jgi:non-specific serine/threonine protein kinase
MPVQVPEVQRADAHRVSRPLTSFIGRERELALIVGLLGRSGVRLLTITGPGGVGKTRLALRIVDKARDTFNDGAAFIPLAAVRDPALILPTVVRHLAVPDAPGQPLLSRLTAFLADSNLLLVLDNAEHLIDAMPFVVDLLASCPRLTILVTSRMQLNVSGEHLLPLNPLSPDEARTLFADRARALMPEFALTDEVTRVVDMIAARLDGLPLAIELAASRVPALPPRAILARLDHRLDLLTSGPRDAPARQRGMRDAIGWSHDLLPDAHQLLFRHLGVFIGGFTLEAAEAVAGNDIDVLDGIATLVAASLIVPTRGVADEPRYTMLETIREFALERLTASGEEPAARARHAAWYCQLAESALPLYDGPDVQITSDRVDIELGNCRAAMTWALEARAAEIGVRLAGALWRIWQLQATGEKPWMDRMAEGLAWIERMLPMRDGLPVDALTEALIGVGAFSYLLRGDIDLVQVLGEELLARARAERYPYGEYWALLMLGLTARERGDLATARGCYERARALAPGIRNPDNHEAMALNWLGRLQLGAGDATAAARHLEEALRISHKTGNTWLVADIASDLGRALHAQGQLGPASARMHEALLAFNAIRRSFEVHASLVNLATMALAIDQPERAARLLGAASGFPSYPLEVDAFNRAITGAKAGASGAAFVAAFDAGTRFAWYAVLGEVDALIDAASSTSPATLPNPANPYDLSRREVDVLRYLAEGDSNRAIADTLSLSERTVENHVAHIFAKLEVTSRAAAAAFAIRHDLI